MSERLGQRHRTADHDRRSAPPPPKLLEPATLVLWDFEAGDDLDGWNTTGVQAAISSDWASHSKSSVRLTYGTEVGVPGFDISADHYDFLEFGDHETFVLEIRNPGPVKMPGP